MKRHEPQVVEIATLAEDGCGYSEDGRFAVFGAIEGEVVTARQLSRKRKKHYLIASEIHSASPRRVKPACDVASTCGGCSFQHLDREAQLELKSRFVQNQLAPLVADNWLPALTGSAVGYRSKARLGVKYVEKKGRVLVGFREKQKPYITDTRNCPVLASGMDTLITSLQDLVADLSVRKSIPQIEVAAGDDKVALVIRHLESVSDDDLNKLESFAAARGLWIYLQPGGIDTIHRIYPDDSQELLSYSLPDQDLSFDFSPLDFTQVNLEINRLMVNRALALLEPEAGDVVLDAFCGIGNFSLAVARSGARVVGVEQSATSIGRARRNMERNDLVNAEFFVGDLHSEPPEVPDLSGFNKVLLDPPRSGAEGLTKVLESRDTERVVYVSCNPETLARDAKILCSRGFNLSSAGIIDMFPHTTHVESIALFTRQ